MRTLYISIIVASAVLASGCTINQTVTPVQLSQDLAPEICMIPAKGLREGFNTTYVRLLTEKGFHTRQIPPGSSPSSCPLTTTYIGTWSWDVAIYMSYADIRVYQFGQQVGQAEYGFALGRWTCDRQVYQCREKDHRDDQPVISQRRRRVERHPRFELSCRHIPPDKRSLPAATARSA